MPDITITLPLTQEEADFINEHPQWDVAAAVRRALDVASGWHIQVEQLNPDVRIMGDDE